MYSHIMFNNIFSARSKSVLIHSLYLHTHLDGPRLNWKCIAQDIQVDFCLHDNHNKYWLLVTHSFLSEVHMHPIKISALQME